MRLAQEILLHFLLCDLQMDKNKELS